MLVVFPCLALLNVELPTTILEVVSCEGRWTIVVVIVAFIVLGLRGGWAIENE